jgi:hypothetical protein
MARTSSTMSGAAAMERTSSMAPAMARTSSVAGVPQKE